MSIRARMIVIPLSIVLHYSITKTSNLTFIGCHNIQHQSCSMIVTTSVCAPSWHDNIHVCALTRFAPYPLHKFRLTLSFSYLWLWNISVLTLCHVLSADYARVRLVHLFSFFLCLHRVETKENGTKKCLHRMKTKEKGKEIHKSYADKVRR